MFGKFIVRKGAIVVLTALASTFITVVPTSMAQATPEVSSTTTTNPTNSGMVGTINQSLFTAAILANTAVAHGATTTASGQELARSAGLISQDAASGTGQTATVRASGVLSLYTKVSTHTAISADGGTFSGSATSATSTATTGTNSTLFTQASTNNAGAPIATLWTAPSTPGTYTITLNSANGTVALTPTLTSPTLGVTGASIVVTVTNSFHGTSISDSATNTRALIGKENNSLFTAVTLSTSGSAVVSSATSVATAHLTAKSLGLLTKDSTVGTAQTATVLASGVLSLYANVTTTVAFTSSAGTFSTTANGAVPTFNQTRSTILMTNSSVAAGTSVGVTWTAPSAAGTYTIAMYYHGDTPIPTTSAPGNGALGAAITVTVVAASAGGSYSAVNSYCRISNVSNHFNVGDNIDGTAATVNGNSMWVNFALNDAYGNDLSDGNIVVTATNSALISYNDAATAIAGTSSTVVAYDDGAGDSIRVTQGTANAPQVTTVTITYNGTTVCAKTVAIYGEVAKLVVNVTDTQDLSSGTGKANFLDDGWDATAGGTARAGHFTVLATDAAGNQVAPSGGGAAASSVVGTFAVNAASLVGQTIVTGLDVNFSATVTSSTSAGRLNTGTYTCGATAGEVKTAKIDFTNSGSGKVISSDAFSLRCADNPSTYTASWDKASYVQGEIATLTVKFLDSKGNAANSTSDTGTWVGVTPMLTAVSTTGTAGGLDKNGVKTFTYTVGTASGITAGTYTSIIDYTTLTGAGAAKSTPTYKLTTGGDTTTNADVLKSIVALIASINKQIQALQKLILKR